MSTLKSLTAATLMCATLTIGAPTAAAGAGANDKPQAFAGEGHGYVTLPTTRFEGWFNADLEDERGVPLFTIDARLTTFVPTTTFGPDVPVLFGGIYGTLREAVPPGVHLFVQMPPIAMVEGYWTLENDNTGSFQLSTYVRDPNGTYRRTGEVNGDMRVREMIFPPQDGGLAGAALQAQKKDHYAGLALAKRRAQGVGSSPAPGQGLGQGTLAAAVTAKKKQASASPGSGLITGMNGISAVPVKKQAISAVSAKKLHSTSASVSSSGPAPLSPARTTAAIIAKKKQASASSFSPSSSWSASSMNPARSLSANSIGFRQANQQQSGSSGQQQAVPLKIGTHGWQGMVRGGSVTRAVSSARGSAMIYGAGSGSGGGAPSPVPGLRLGEFKLTYHIIN